MTRFRRVSLLLQWGVFYGIITWLAATAITNKFPAAGVWGIIVSRALMGFLIGYFEIKLMWWIRGIAVGLVVNLAFGGLAFIVNGDLQNFFFGWVIGFWLMLITGIIIGPLMELTLRHKSQPPDMGF